MAELFDRTINKWVEVPEDQDLNKHVASGRYAFEGGIDLPIVTPDGKLESIKSDQAEELFQKGYRWQTNQDREINTQNQLRASDERNYDMPGTAGAFAATNTALLGLPAAGLSAIGLGEETRKMQEQNPTATTVGNVAGFIPAAAEIALSGGAALGIPLAAQGARAAGSAARIANPLGEVISHVASPLAGSVAKAIAPAGKVIESVIPGVVSETPTILSTGYKVAKNLAPNVAKGAGEGVVYGLGHGLSEAVLDPDPSHTVQHLVAGGEMGGLFGGLLGGAFGGLVDSAPLIKEIAKNTATAASDYGSSIISKIAGSALKNRMRAAGKGDLTPDADVLLANPGSVEKLNKLGDSPFNTLSRDADRATAELEKHVANNEAALQAKLKSVPAEQRAQIKQQLEEASGDAVEASKNMYARQLQAESQFRNDVATEGLPSKSVGQLYDKTLERIEQLRMSKDPAATKLANRLQNSLDGELSAAGLPSDIRSLPAEARSQFLNERLSVAQELEMAQRLKSEIPSKYDSFKAKRDHEAIQALRDDIDNISLGGVRNEKGAYSENSGNPYEPVRHGLRSLTQHDEAINSFANAIGGKSGSNIEQFANMSKGAAPKFASQVDSLAGNLEKFYPEIQGFKESFKNAVERQNTVDAFQSKFNGLRDASTTGKISNDDAERLLNQLTDGKADLGDLERVRQMQALLAQTQDLTPAAKLIAMKNALGQDIQPYIRELQQLEPAYAAAQRLRQARTDASMLSQVLPTVGALGFGGSGYGLTKAATSIIDSAADPMRSIQTIGAIQRAYQKSTRLVDKTVNSVVTNLTKPTLQRNLTQGMATISEQRKEFPKQVQTLAAMQDMNHASDYASERLGNWSGAPQTQAAMVSHMMKIADFLVNKMPTDPLAGADPFSYDQYIPGDKELAKFNRYVSAAQSPNTVLHHISQGTVTPEEIETLQVIYPSIYNKLQIGIMNDITSRRVTPTYQQKIILGTTFNLPTDPTLQPEMIGKLQANHAASQPEAQGGRPEGKSIKIDLKPLENLATDTTRITNK